MEVKGDSPFRTLPSTKAYHHITVRQEVQEAAVDMGLAGTAVPRLVSSISEVARVGFRRRSQGVKLGSVGRVLRTAIVIAKKGQMDSLGS